ncbi:MAG TPA: hypothetical protein RMH99_29755 [Sandaracinaceae bacterium LLY-WYZ-13_1]|nr:hypothetical protein [Sandaracinaceae bacterium LLY-WYZ-13_1]
MPALSRRAALVTLALALSAIACAAPVLPLPPPTALVEEPDADGVVTVMGEARPGAFVACLNENTEAGVLVRADVDTGAYVARLPAETGHAIRVWQFEASDAGGEPVFRTVP